MNDSLSRDQRFAAENDPSAVRPRLDGPGIVKLVLVVFGSLVLTVVILSMLFVFLDNGRNRHRHMRQTTQVRGIVQGIITYAGGNKERMPGVTSKGYLVKDVYEGDLSVTAHGGTVEGRFWLLLDNNAFTSEYIISPSRTKTRWTTGAVSSDNYSFALLNIHSDGKALADDKTRPDQRGRAREWKQSINTQAVLIADRARIPGGRIGENYDKIYSVHTTKDSEQWAGAVGRGDGSAAFENESALDTKYGKGPEIEADRLFSRSQDPGTYTDILNTPGDTWDDQSNALLGYTSVGYEDGDVASE